jgi:membrane-bound lytic murein transglycosylase D
LTIRTSTQTWATVLWCWLLLTLSACSTPSAPIEQRARLPEALAKSGESTSPPSVRPADTRRPTEADALNGGASNGANSGNLAIDPLDPAVPIHLDDGLTVEAARQDLWQRVRQGFSMPTLDTELVRNQEQWYASRPDYVQRMTARGGRYLFHIVEEVERRGMPSELALLPFIESAFNPQAISSAQASGMWQFMPTTGKYFDLKQNLFRDDRRDVLASTRAALDYLQKLHRMFGHWHLALAAYNWGEGSVQRAIARNKKAGLPTDYLSLKMPQETRNYVPKLQAVKNIIANPARLGIALPPLENHPYFLAIPIERDIDVNLAAKLSGLTETEFRSLNPQINKPVILAAGTPQLLLPYDNADEFLRGLKSHPGQLATWTAWTAPRTLRLQEAAKLVGMNEAHLREVNRIPPRMLIKAGSTLMVTRSAHKTQDVSEQVADNASMRLAADNPIKMRRMTVKVTHKDTLLGLAKRHRVSVAQLRQWNQLDARAVPQPGQRLVVFLPQKTVASRAPARHSRVAIASGPKNLARAPGAQTKKMHARSNTRPRMAKN